MAYGLTDYGEQQALIALLPNGTSRYVLLYTTLPGEDGSGGVEASGSGYARPMHNAWVNGASGDITQRKNNGAVTFAALTDALPGVLGWGVADALTGGNVIAYGEVKDAGGNAVTKDFITGDQPRFIDQELKVGID